MCWSTCRHSSLRRSTTARSRSISNVVVGKPARATPQVSAKIVEVNFYPTWSVPDIVAQNDLIPTIRKDPNYFYEQHFNVMRDWRSPPLDPASIDWASPQVVSYKFRQDPGPQNALGVVRINMPNKHSVYMHDTPLKTPVRPERARLLLGLRAGGESVGAGRLAAGRPEGLDA